MWHIIKTLNDTHSLVPKNLKKQIIRPTSTRQLPYRAEANELEGIVGNACLHVASPTQDPLVDQGK